MHDGGAPSVPLSHVDDSGTDTFRPIGAVARAVVDRLTAERERRAALVGMLTAELQHDMGGRPAYLCGRYSRRNLEAFLEDLRDLSTGGASQ